MPKRASVLQLSHRPAAGNVIGRGDWAADRLIPDCVRAFSHKKQVQIRNPLATRPSQHVLEPLSGYLLLAENLWRAGAEHSQAWNFGPATEASDTVANAANEVVAAWGDGADWVQQFGHQPHEAHLLAVDFALARARLKWRQRWPLNIAIARTVAWYKQQIEGESAAKLVEADIAYYEQSPGILKCV